MLVHGFGVSGRYLVPTAARLAIHHRVLVPDLPGYGRSDRPAKPLGVDELASFLAEWLAAVDVGRPDLLADSFGCQTVVHLAALHPDRVGRLVLVGPTIDRHARSFGRQTLRLMHDMLRSPPGLVAIAAYDYGLFTLRGQALAVARSMLTDRLEEWLPRVTAPTVVVRGARDAIVSQEWAEEVAALLPQGRLHVIPGSSHAVNYAAPDALTGAAVAFLSVRNVIE